MERLRDSIRTLEPRPAAARELRLLRRESIEASARIAGSALTASEVAALLDRGIALGGHLLADYVSVREYADAAAYAWSRRAPLPPARAWASVDEVRRLHTLAVRSEPESSPGAWRTTNPRAPADGHVAPPYWSVPREVQATTERINATIGIRPDALVTAEAIARIERIEPFSSANGRVGRLFADIILARRGYPPFVIDERRREAYLVALGAARLGDARSLARIVADAVLRSLRRIEAATRGEPLILLAELVAPNERAAAYKAAQRGRLAVVERDGRTYSTAAWLAEYCANRAPGGRPGASARALPRRSNDVIDS